MESKHGWNDGVGCDGCGCDRDCAADAGKMIPEAGNDHFAGAGKMVNDVQQDADLDLSARAAGATGVRQEQQ